MTDTTHDHDVEHDATEDVAVDASESTDHDPAGVADEGASPVDPADPTPPALTRAARIGTAIAALVVVIYVATSILMVVPQSDATRALTAAARPYFGQQWNVFAPSIQKTNRYLEMQAQWRDDSGALVKSEWVDITRAEYEAGEGRIQSSRTVKQSANLLKTYTERFRGLTREQQAIVQDTFIRRADTDSGFAAKTAVSLIDQLQALDEGSRGRVITMLRADYVLKEFTTYWATAWFGRDIERVRWRVATERPNDFAHRSDEQQQFTPSTRTFGWREADDVIDPQALSVYQGIVERYAR
ncbi:DUF5819 family protein [Clavibacter sepedonicus]|uniref:Membrane protein n=1 Tax=Clavibacter sepedonicus TaxID=31964 RepID=B0RIG6_CLASE|nr:MULTISPECIES: DUF5819 family protein [Clavibacter]MBD5381207.1 S46 family peptidase [Clavibacter sp.]OQJ48738.1 hypothetical protein B5P19_11105 [Clavibacter sepedonicus]OQJ54283.1 hypothetical protein B5P20_09290 [Clavibacter sepedonicus]UUK65831.1 DUF5819 family protein [Clavibacter sepedonicus]CAQ00280.1 putative membrane protein [Clavibacter sepedonicus]